MAMYECRFCNAEFSRTFARDRHINERRCSWLEKATITEIMKKVEEQIHKDTSEIVLKLEARAINDLDVSHIPKSRMLTAVNAKELPSTFLICEYIKDILCDPEHPENHAVKFAQKKLPLFSIVFKSDGDQVVRLAKGLDDAAELIVVPMMDILKSKIKECQVKVVDQKTCDYDAALWKFSKSVNKDNVKKAVLSFLICDILSNPKMKYVF